MTLSLAIELMVAFLLVVTIGYCVILNKRLSRLRADEATLRATISELITATEIAERAILGLKATAADCDQTLGNRLRAAESVSDRLTDQIKSGESLVDRVSSIAEAANRSAAAKPQPATIARQGRDESPAPSLKSAATLAAARLKAIRSSSLTATEAAE